MLRNWEVWSNGCICHTRGRIGERPPNPRDQETRCVCVCVCVRVSLGFFFFEEDSYEPRNYNTPNSPSEFFQ